MFDSNIMVLFHSWAEGGLLPDTRGWVLFSYPDPYSLPVLFIDWLPGVYFVCDRKDARVSSSILERKEALNSV